VITKNLIKNIGQLQEKKIDVIEVIRWEWGFKPIQIIDQIFALEQNN